jgi:hypothetical protein
MKYGDLLMALPLIGGLWQNGNTSPGLPAGQATLETRLEGERLTLIGHYQNASPVPQSLYYELVTGKKGPAGTSQNSQSGRFTVAPHQTATLSQTTISVAPADVYRVKLRVLDLQGSVVAEDSLVHQPTPRP